MSKSILEELLLKAGTLNEEVEKRADANQKSVIKNTMKEEVRKFIKEAVEEDEEDDSMEYDETSVEDNMEVDTEMDMADAEDATSETGDTDEADEEFPMGDDANIEVDMDVDAHMDTTIGGEEEVMDLTNATEEEVLQTLQNLPDDAKIEIVKKPSYGVNVVGGNLDMGDTDNVIDTEGEDMDEGVYEMDEGMHKMKESNMHEMDEGEMHEMDETENMDETKTVSEKCVDETVLEMDKMMAENKKMKSYTRKLMAENKRLKANEKKAVEMIKESMNKMKALALTNSKLAFVSQLFTENSTTRNEKERILKKFDTVNTIGEAEITFKMLNESFSNRSTRKPNIKKNKVSKRLK